MIDLSHETEVHEEPIEAPPDENTNCDFKVVQGVIDEGEESEILEMTVEEFKRDVYLGRALKLLEESSASLFFVKGKQFKELLGREIYDSIRILEARIDNFVNEFDRSDEKSEV